MERSKVLLKATLDILKKCDKSPYVLDPLTQVAVWDGVECDGGCLMEEIEDYLNNGYVEPEQATISEDMVKWIQHELPFNSEWWRDGDSEFIEATNQMLKAGMSEEDIKPLLQGMYAGVASEYGS